MIRVDPRQFDLFDVLTAPPIPSFPLFAKGREVVAIGDQRQPPVAKIESSGSGYSLATSGKVARPFSFRGDNWVNTSASYFRGDADYVCYRIVPAEAFTGPGEARTYHEHSFHGEHRETLGGYHAMKAKCRGADVVLVGPPVIFVLKNGGA